MRIPHPLSKILNIDEQSFNVLIVLENREILVSGEIAVNSEAFENLTVLCDKFGSRFFATTEEKAAADFMVKKLREYGLQNVQLDPSTLFGWKDGKLIKLPSWKRGDASLELIEPLPQKLSCISLANVPSTQEKGITAEIINLESASRAYVLEHRDDFKGKIVLMGTYYPTGVYGDPKDLPHGSTTIYGYLVEFGAAGMIWASSNYGGLPKTGAVRFGFIGEIPALGISRETSDFILRQMTKGPVRANLRIKNTYGTDATTYNVTAELPGHTYPDKVILVGGHYDGHDIAPGAMDDAAGACVVMEAARALAKHGGSFKRTIRFCCFSGEEMGLVGSTGYVLNHADEIKNIELMINTDSCGISATTGHGFIACGSKELASYLEQISYSLGTFDRNWEVPKVTDKIGPYSDHFPFYKLGVPAACLRDVPADPRDMLYSHTSVDTVDKVDSKGLKDSALILALALMKIADAEEIPVKHTPIKNIIKVLEETETKIAEDLRIEKRLHRESPG